MGKNVKGFTLVLIGIFLAGIIQNDAHAYFECPEDIKSEDARKIIESIYEVETNNLEIQAAAFQTIVLPEENMPKALSNYLLNENKNQIEKIGQIAYCLILGESDPNLIASPNASIESAVLYDLEKFSEHAPEYVTYVLDYDRTTGCNNYLQDSMIEKYDGYVYSLNVDVSKWISSHNINNDLDIGEKRNVFESVFSDEKRLKDLVKNRNYLEQCNVDFDDRGEPSEQTMQILEMDPHIGGPFIVYATEQYSPKQQINFGTPIDKIHCKESLVLVIHPDAFKPACVKSSTMNALVERDWIFIDA